MLYGPYKLPAFDVLHLPFFMVAILLALRLAIVRCALYQSRPKTYLEHIAFL